MGMVFSPRTGWRREGDLDRWIGKRLKNKILKLSEVKKWERINMLFRTVVDGQSKEKETAGPLQHMTLSDKQKMLPAK